MLGETNKFNNLTAYHIVNYDNLLFNHINNFEKDSINELNEKFKQKGIDNRIIDDIQVSADYAHEYKYIFINRNYPSKITKRSKKIFEELCKKIRYISENENPLLLKNPDDFNNFLTIKKYYKNAKFIFIHRNPLNVINSMMRASKALFEYKNPYTAMFSKQYDNLFNYPIVLFLVRKIYASSYPPGILNAIYNANKNTKYYLKNIRFLSDNDYISIRYEDLCKNPNKIIGDILNYLNIKSEKDFSNYIKQRNLSVSYDVKFMEGYIKRKMKEYFTFAGYS